jgi:hypothetical protein
MLGKRYAPAAGQVLNQIIKTPACAGVFII